MRNFKTEGIVIKRRNYAEADRILTVFTQHHGKIQVKASGIRRVPSRRSAHVELLNHSLLTLYKGNMFPTLTEAQTLDSFSLIKADFDKIGFAYHICELIDGLCPENQESPQVFALLKHMFTRLSITTKENLNTVIHKFELDLLSALGYWSQTETAYNFDTHDFIEGIMERKLKSHKLFAKLQ